MCLFLATASKLFHGSILWQDLLGKAEEGEKCEECGKTEASFHYAALRHAKRCSCMNERKDMS